MERLGDEDELDHVLPGTLAHAPGDEPRLLQRGDVLSGRLARDAQLRRDLLHVARRPEEVEHVEPTRVREGSEEPDEVVRLPGLRFRHVIHAMAFPRPAQGPVRDRSSLYRDRSI